MLVLAFLTAYNLLEGAVSVWAGVAAGSVVLVGFGLDSVVEVSAAVVVLLHLSRTREEEMPEWERRVAVFVGMTLLAVGVYVLARSIYSLAARSEPSESVLGIVITTASVVVMPALARLQSNLAVRLNSRALAANSRETIACTYLSVAALVGLVLNAALGWWWADPVAGIALAALIGREGLEIVRSKELICVD